MLSTTVRTFSRVHRILVSTLAIHSATEPPSISSIVPAFLFAELCRIMSEYSLSLADKLQHSSKQLQTRIWRDQFFQRCHRSLCPQSSSYFNPLSPIALHLRSSVLRRLVITILFDYVWNIFKNTSEDNVNPLVLFCSSWKVFERSSR